MGPAFKLVLPRFGLGCSCADARGRELFWGGISYCVHASATAELGSAAGRAEHHPDPIFLPLPPSSSSASKKLIHEFPGHGFACREQLDQAHGQMPGSKPCPSPPSLLQLPLPAMAQPWGEQLAAPSRSA